MNTHSFDVVTVGNAIVDLINPTDFDFLDRHGLVPGSMSLIDKNQSESLLKETGIENYCSGGSAANTAVGVASLGGKACFIGKVKNDSLGKIFIDSLRSTGVIYKTSLAKSGPQTAQSIISVTPDAERTMCTYLGACLNLDSNDIEEETIASAKINYFEGYLWDPPKARSAFKKIILIAHEYNRKVSLTLSDSFCVDRHRKGFLDLLRGSVDILFSNEDEILALYKLSNIEEAVRIARSQCEVLVVTRGAKGSIIADCNNVYLVDSIPVEKVVDRNGAGDLFAAGFLYGLSQNYEIQRCGHIGSIAATEVITHYGARPEKSLHEMLDNS